MNPSDRLIVALDGDNQRMLHLIAELVCRTPVRFFKLSPANLMQPHSEALVRSIRTPWPGGYHDDLNGDLFLDLKCYDTRDSVERMVKIAFNDVGARFVTVHATPSVMQAALRAKSADDRCKVLAVGPTSDQSSTLEDRMFGTDVSTGLCSTATIAIKIGVDGIICPAGKANIINDNIGIKLYDQYIIPPKPKGFLVVCPAVRPGGDGSPEYFGGHAVSNVGSPVEALQNGADYIVVGRPIWQADDPVAATLAIIADMESQGSTVR